MLALVVLALTPASLAMTLNLNPTTTAQRRLILTAPPGHVWNDKAPHRVSCGERSALVRPSRTHAVELTIDLASLSAPPCEQGHVMGFICEAKSAASGSGRCVRVTADFSESALKSAQKEKAKSAP